MIGPIINPVGVLVGSILGAAFGRRIPERLRISLPMIFGIAAMGMGVSMIVRVQQLPAVVLSLLVGTIIGELLRLEDRVRKLAIRLRSLAGRLSAAGHPAEEIGVFSERYVAMLVLFCLSGAAILGALQEGLTGDSDILIIKALLDLFTSIIFAATLGYALAFTALPQFLIQAGLFLLASRVMPYTTEVMLADFSALGGLIMLATGFRICRVIDIPLTNLVPSMLIVFPVSAFWAGL